MSKEPTDKQNEEAERLIKKLGKTKDRKQRATIIAAIRKTERGEPLGLGPLHIPQGHVNLVDQ